MFGASPFGSAAPAGQGGAEVGEDLKWIQLEGDGLGLKSLAGDTKLQLLSSPWPTDALPPPTSSLLSVASTKGILAAGGPDSIVIASTDAIREGFTASSDTATDIRPFTPQLTIQLGTRISQVAFSSDESVLAISAELGGGLAVYEVQSLLQGKTQSAFEMATNGVSIRSLVPNPAAPTAEYFAMVTVKGDLMIANMKSKDFVAGQNGPVLKDGVSCLSWSNKGKQLVAGLGNGTCWQMTPDGQKKAEIPRPPRLEGDQHVSSIFWLENDLFLIAHTPSAGGDGMAPPTTYHLVTRKPGNAGFVFQQFPEICGPFGLNRSPSYQFMQRLRNFQPNLQDMIIVTSTASEDVGVFTRVSQKWQADAPENVFTTTSLPESRNGQIPLSADMSSTSPIGMALDFSSKTKVFKPLQFGEMDESSMPVPALYIINNEGVLVAYWIIYADAIKENIIYSGMTSATGEQPTQMSQGPKTTFGSAPAAQSAFGQSGFAKQASPAFGAPSTPASSAFGAPSAFGAATSLGSKASPWGASQAGPSAQKSAFSQPAFGQSTFGQPSSMGAPSQTPAFGSSGGLGQRPSPWATPSAPTTAAASGAAFGKPSGLGAQTNTSSPFGSSAATNSASPFTSAAGSGSGFASFASKGGFAQSAAANTTNTPKIGESAFKSATPAASFDSKMDIGSSFGGTSFGGTPKKPEESGGIFGAPKGDTPGGPFNSKGFVLGSAWTNENPEKPDTSKAPQTTGSTLFGSDFRTSLNNAAKTPAPAPSTEADMEEQPKSPPQTTTPADTPAPAKFFAPATSSDIFGLKNNDKTPAAGERTNLFGTSKPGLETPQPIPPIIKREPSDNVQGVDRNLPEPPLPPDSVSKTTFTPGTSSTSSTGGSKLSLEDTPSVPKQQPSPLATDEQSSDSSRSKVTVVNDAPLPPDFLPLKQKSAATPAAPEEAPLPSHSESEGLSDEGSGIDVTQELSPDPSPKITPESSFGGLNRSPVGERFTNIQRPPSTQGGGAHWGELGKNPIPQLHPSGSRVQQSPRSPSPIRPAHPTTDFLRPRPDVSRTSSAPIHLGPNGQQKAPIGQGAQGRLAQEIIPKKPSVSLQQRRDDSEHRRAQEEERRREEEEQELSDREDERVREELSTQVEGSLNLEPFIAHQDYVGNIKKEGIPGQIETVYRDINSMIDTLGLNSRSLQAFIKGHSEDFREGGRDREDLENPEDWTLVEIEDLDHVERDLATELDVGRIEDVDDFLSSCRSLQKDLGKLRTKQNDIKRTIEARTHPDHIAALRAAPLSAEQSMLRYDLRKEFTAFQKSLAQAEEAISLLKAKLASLNSSKSKGRGTGPKVPTVEAVERTILKMTTMVEKKSGDIDFLENQMRKLNVVGSPSSGDSRGSSPFVTPPTSAMKGRGLPRTPGSRSNTNKLRTPRR